MGDADPDAHRSSRVNIVALSPYVPYAGIDHAGGSFLHSYLTALAPYVRSQLFVPESPTNSAKAGDSPVPVSVLPVGRRSPLFARKIDAALRAPTPGRDLFRAFARDRELHRSILAADIVELHWGYLLALVPWVRHISPAVPIAVHGHDVIGVSEARRAERATDPLSRALRRAHAKRVTERECRYVNSCNIAYYFSAEDVRVLREHAVRTPLRVLDPNLETRADRSPRSSAAPTVLFVGALHRRENSDGIRWFLDEVWPAVRQRVPEAKLVIAGANPPDHIKSAAGSHVDVTGYRRDLSSLYADADVFVAPLLSGAGLKFKVAQAMIFGLPVVATEIAAEGFERDVFAAVTSDPGITADSVVRLLRDDRWRAQVGAAGQDWATERFSFERSIHAVVRDYEQMAAGLPLEE